MPAIIPPLINVVLHKTTFFPDGGTLESISLFQAVMRLLALLILEARLQIKLDLRAVALTNPKPRELIRSSHP